MKKVILFFLAALCLFLFSCGNEKYVEKTFFALDTVIKIDIEKTDNAEYLLSECEKIVLQYENIFSMTKESSDIYKINHNNYDVSYEVLRILEFSKKISEDTNGAFDVTIAPVSQLWDFKNIAEPKIPFDDDIKEALENVGYEKYDASENTLTKNSSEVQFDLGGIAKGYIAGKVSDYLHENGVDSGVMSFGGNIAVLGAKENGEKWNVGIKAPDAPNMLVGTVKRSNGYISVSGNYERCFEYNGVLYHHILDAKTGYPVDNSTVSVAVISENAALADALSTALFVMGVENAYKLYKSKIYDFEAIIINDEKSVYLTDKIKNEFVLTNVSYNIKDY